ncbi:protein-glutamate methylesterase/protein-glutamine glutaminase [Sphingomonas nostoxanthinifaciens]|uniref:protein-glutamate methylesterase/protein-glutamine glutaminase n=1 Tax=Sphingomonas nostoxanthinifaciens TaxID=2872652 RepID=UPI001CC1E22D|nr:chemotaxis response regulator protein-glutamate methylesterase [Sphingomonas nostoxanthinifaciens]UAK26043.1 chemotaxis response regulator protein-glutamate methylesterase [Sphingomonas nostoxanthinifaciens]
MTVRAMVVDDSPTMRVMIARLLDADPDIEVVGTADCPAAARQKIKDLSPDVITLDVEMPGMNGLDFLDKIMRLRPMPVVMVSTLTERGADATVRALEIGAFDCYAKPSGSLASAALADGGRLVSLVKQAAGIRVQPRTTSVARAVEDYTPRPDALIAIGSSTGGVEALVQLLACWPANCPPTVITQHMPALFTKSFAARLDRLCAATVQEARSGAPLTPGHVYLAPGGEAHLEVQGGSAPRCRLVVDELTSGHRPSVDRLFHSVAKAMGGSAVGAILTGMGRDGAVGMKAMRDAGAFTIGQDEQSCVVYGMPQAAFAAGAVTTQLPLRAIGPRLLQECQA